MQDIIYARFTMLKRTRGKGCEVRKEKLGNCSEIYKQISRLVLSVIFLQRLKLKFSKIRFVWSATRIGRRMDENKLSCMEYQSGGSNINL